MLLNQAAMAAAAVPVVTQGYGILAGAHGYKGVKIPQLPKSFHGIGQLSDIHCASFELKMG